LTHDGGATTAGDEAAILSVLLDAAPVGFAYYDRERRYVHINDSLAAANGRTPAEHVGRTIREIVPEVAVHAEPLIDQVLRTGEPILALEMQGQEQDRRVADLLAHRLVPGPVADRRHLHRRGGRRHRHQRRRRGGRHAAADGAHPAALAAPGADPVDGGAGDRGRYSRGGGHRRRR
jgi:PAS domain-containing protein